MVYKSIFSTHFDPGTPKRGHGGQAPLLPFLKGGKGVRSALPFVYSILGTVFQPERTTEGTLCSKLTETHLNALLPYQYKAST